MKKKWLLLIVLNGTVTSMLLIFNWLFLQDAPIVFSTINILSIFIFAFPIIIMRYLDYSKKRQIEDLFPIFLRDFVEGVRGGLTVPRAFESISVNDYRALTPYVKKIAAQLDWGIPVDVVLKKFSEETKSKLISRVVFSVIESHKYGGNLADTFEALSNTAVEVARLKEERKLYLHSQMITGYIIFFVFLGVIIGLERFLVPSFSQTNPLQIGQAQSQADLAAEYKEIFRNLILMQGLFAGLAVGKMAEGAIIAGLKHSMFMMFVGAIVFTVAA